MIKRGSVRTAIGAIFILILSSTFTLVGTSAIASPKPHDRDNHSHGSAGRDHAHPKPRTVPKKQRYDTRVTVAQGEQTPVVLKDLTAVTKLTQKQGDIKARGLVFSLDDQQGLRLSASTDTKPGTYRLRAVGQGCYETQCSINFEVSVTATVTKPVPATPGVETFTKPSQDRIANAAPLPFGGVELRDELILTLGTPDAPGNLSQAVALAQLIGATVTGGIEEIGVFQLRTTTATDLDAATAILTSQPGVASVSRTTFGLIQTNAEPDGDWDDDGPAATWPFTQIRAQQAWDITTGSTAVTVGVVDHGAAYKDHEDLNVTEVLAGAPEHHATHVAGLMCAEANGIGLVGVSWGCPIVSSGTGDMTDTEVLEAMRKVAKSGARVVNMSIGYAPENRSNLCLSTSEASEFVEYANNNSGPFWQFLNGPNGRNVIWTFSAGNNCSPGAQSPWTAAWSLPNVIVVASTNSDGQLSAFSNFGDGVEVAAPGGVGVAGISGGAGGVWSTSVKNCNVFFKCSDYKQDFGTSMASPVVGGVAALAQSVDLDKRAPDVASCVVNTAGSTVGSATTRSAEPRQSFRTPLVDLTRSIPIVNAEAAVRCAKGGTSPGGILVAGAGDRTGSGNGTDIGDLTAAFVRTGRDATTSQTLPEDLSSYQQIWYIDTNALTQAEMDRLAAFVQAGKSIYLTGEWGCCQVDTSTIALLNRLTKNTGGQIAHGGSGTGDVLTVNPAAPGRLAQDPNAISSITVSAGGQLSGVPSANVVASAPGSTLPVVAAWDRPDVVGSGKIIVVMDINWFAEQYRGSNWEQVAQNFVQFLGKS